MKVAGRPMSCGKPSYVFLRANDDIIDVAGRHSERPSHLLDCVFERQRKTEHNHLF